MADAVLTASNGVVYRITVEDDELWIRVEGPDGSSAAFERMEPNAGNEWIVRAKLRPPMPPTPIIQHPLRRC